MAVSKSNKTIVEIDPRWLADIAFNERLETADCSHCLVLYGMHCNLRYSTMYQNDPASGKSQSFMELLSFYSAFSVKYANHHNHLAREVLSWSEFALALDIQIAWQCNCNGRSGMDIDTYTQVHLRKAIFLKLYRERDVAVRGRFIIDFESNLAESFAIRPFNETRILFYLCCEWCPRMEAEKKWTNSFKS